MQAISDIKRCLRKCGPSGVIEGTARAEVRHREVQRVDVVTVLGEIVNTQNPVESVMRADQLQFLSELLLIQRIGKLRDTVG